jgi:hypothetical protein
VSTQRDRQAPYLSAPELAKPQGMSGAEQFWAIKHDVKLSAVWRCRTSVARHQSVPALGLVHRHDDGNQ